MHGYRLHPNGVRNAAGPSANRPVFTGSADQIASDIRRYEALGVGHLIASFVPVAQIADSREEMLNDMEEFAARVWPKV